MAKYELKRGKTFLVSLKLLTNSNISPWYCTMYVCTDTLSCNSYLKFQMPCKFFFLRKIILFDIKIKIKICCLFPLEILTNNICFRFNLLWARSPNLKEKSWYPDRVQYKRDYFVPVCKMECQFLWGHDSYWSLNRRKEIIRLHWVS